MDRYSVDSDHSLHFPTWPYEVAIKILNIVLDHEDNIVLDSATYSALEKGLP